MVFGPLSVLALIGPVGVLWWASRHSDLVREADVVWCWRVAIANAGVRLLTMPVIADLWLYVLIGREFVSGRNPYYAHPPVDVSLAYSVDPDGPFMTYGPLWAWLSNGLTRVAGPSPVVEAIAFKVLAFAAWWAAFWAVRELTRRSMPAQQLRAVVLTGWLPVMLHQAIGEGHNDGLVAAGIALWLYLRARESAWSGAPVAFATLVKYNTLPLLGLALADAVRRRRWREAVTTTLCSVVAASTALPLYEGRAMFAGLRQQAAIAPLLSMSAAVHALVVGGAHLSVGVSDAVIWMLRAAVAAGALIDVRRHLQRPDHEALCRAALALTTSVVLVWPVVAPWYFVWLAPLLALTSSSWAGALMLPPTLLVPLAEVAFLDGPLRRFLSYAAVLAYGAGLARLVITQWHARRPEWARS